MRRWSSVLGVVLAAVTVNRSLRRVDGLSMLPELWPRDLVLTAPPSWLRPRPGRVVVARNPREPGRSTVKRVASATPHQVVLRGDNAAGSTDSRVYGPVPVALIERTVVACVTPWRWLL